MVVDREHLSLLMGLWVDPVWIIRNSLIVECNRPALSMLGYSDENKVRNRHPARHSPELQADFQNSSDRFNHYLNEAQQYGLQKFEWVLQRSDGVEAIAEVTLAPINLSAGAGFYCVLHDVTESKRLERNLMRSNDRFRLLFEMSPDPVWLIQGNVFIDCNRAAVKTLGYHNKTELLHKSPSDLSLPVQPDGQPSDTKARRMGRLAWEQGLHRFEWVHLKADGCEMLTEVTLIPMELDIGSAVYCTWREIIRQPSLSSGLDPM